MASSSALRGSLVTSVTCDNSLIGSKNTTSKVCPSICIALITLITREMTTVCIFFFVSEQVVYSLFPCSVVNPHTSQQAITTETVVEQSITLTCAGGDTVIQTDRTITRKKEEYEWTPPLSTQPSIECNQDDTTSPSTLKPKTPARKARDISPNHSPSRLPNATPVRKGPRVQIPPSQSRRQVRSDFPHPSTFRVPESRARHIKRFYVVTVGFEVGIFFDW